MSTFQSPSEPFHRRTYLLLFGKSANRGNKKSAAQASESHGHARTSELHVDWRQRLRERLPELCFLACAANSLAGSTIGWNNPLLYANGFRQTQTAMTVWT